MEVLAEVWAWVAGSLAAFSAPASSWLRALVWPWSSSASFWPELKMATGSGWLLFEIPVVAIAKRIGAFLRR